jgi:hypothetical protein
MVQERKSHGREGWLAPATVELHSTSGGKPPFPTCEAYELELYL